MDQGSGASGWEQEGDGGVLGMLESAYGMARSQPLFLAALGAAMLGALIGIVLANRSRPKTRAEQVVDVSRGLGRKTGKVIDDYSKTAGSASRLLPPAMALLGNPLVQAYLRQFLARAVEKQFRGR